MLELRSSYDCRIAPSVGPAQMPLSAPPSPSAAATDTPGTVGTPGAPVLRVPDAAATPERYMPLSAPASNQQCLQTGDLEGEAEDALERAGRKGGGGGGREWSRHYPPSYKRGPWRPGATPGAASGSLWLHAAITGAVSWYSPQPRTRTRAYGWSHGGREKARGETRSDHALARKRELASGRQEGGATH